MKGPTAFWCVLVLCAGLGMGYGAFLIASDTQKLLDAGVKVPGKVIELVESVSRKDGQTSRTYYPVFQYEVAGMTYEQQSSSGSNPPSYRVGETSTLTIDPKDPSNFVTDDFFSRWGGSLILGIFSLVLSLIGGIGAVSMLRKSKNKKWLARNGLSVIAKVIQVGLITSYKINGRSPYRITAQWHNPRTNVVHLFHSENIWYDPSAFVEEQIEVKIDPNNAKVYEVVLDKIPKAA